MTSVAPTTKPHDWDVDDDPRETTIRELRKSIYGNVSDSDEDDKRRDRQHNDEDDVVKGENLVVKKRTRAPAPKFDDLLVCDRKRGIYKVYDQASQLQFKGEGHEASDLKRLLRYYRDWLHELYPREDFSTKVHRLGKIKKDAVRTNLRAMREDQVEKVIRASEPVRPEMETEPTKTKPTNDRAPDDAAQDQTPTTSSSATEIDDQVRAKIERNRLLAMEKKKKMQQQQATKPSSGAQQQTLDGLDADVEMQLQWEEEERRRMEADEMEEEAQQAVLEELGML